VAEVVVAEVVVAAALEDGVGEGGGPVGPGSDVVGFAPLGWSVAAGVAAVLVAQVERLELGVAEGVDGGAVVEDDRSAVGDDAADAGVAQDLLLEVDHDAGVGPVAALRDVVLVVEEEPQDVEEGVGAPLGRRSPRAEKPNEIKGFGGCGRLMSCQARGDARRKKSGDETIRSSS
jgi:hypothetical protein